MSENEWDDINKAHKLNEIPWHSSQPDRNLVGLVKKNKELRIASGA